MNKAVEVMIGLVVVVGFVMICGATLAGLLIMIGAPV